MTRVGVVGAGPAGSITALHLVRRGIGVDLIDRREFPRDKACGDALTTRSLDHLRRMGLGYIADASLCLLSARHWTMNGSFEPRLAFNSSNSVHTLPRLSFDDLLRDAAADAGAILVTAAVRDVTSNQRGCTLTMEQAGVTSEQRYDYLVGADGANSRVASAVALTPKHSKDVAFSIRSYFESDDDLKPVIDLFAGDQLMPNGVGFGWVLPVSAGTANAGVYLVGRRSGRAATAAMKRLGRCLAVEWNAGRLHRVGGTRSGWVRFDFDPEHVSSETTLLVGDAAGLANATTGDGIGPAMESGELAAVHLAEVIEGKATVAEYGERLAATFGQRLESQRRFVRDGSTVADPERLISRGSVWTLSEHGTMPPPLRCAIGETSWSIVVVDRSDAIGERCIGQVQALLDQSQALREHDCSLCVVCDTRVASAPSQWDASDVECIQADLTALRVAPTHGVVGRVALIVRRDATILRIRDLDHVDGSTDALLDELDDLDYEAKLEGPNP